MRTTFVFLLHLLSRVIVALACAGAPSEAATGIALQLVASGVPYLVDIQHAGSSGRLFLVSQTGRIRIAQCCSVTEHTISGFVVERIVRA